MITIQSKLTISKDKGKSTLGEADLNLSDYTENDFKIMRLPLKKCADPDAFIEIGLKAVEAPAAKTPRARESLDGQD